MNILYTCDNNYVWLMGISMLSLFENNKNSQSIVVYLLGENISSENKEKLNSVAKSYGRECIVIDLPDFDLPKTLYSKRWPKSAFSRLFAGKFLPNEVKKVIYLDCDTIVENEIESLWDVDNSDYAIYGVKDCVGKHYRENIGLGDDAIYVNAGVLLMNLDIMRTMNFIDKINSYMSKYEKYIHYADQDMLNGMFLGKFGELPAKYDVMTLLYMHNYKEICCLRHPRNYYSEEEIKVAVENPSIVHFTTCMLNVRPWFENSNHPMLSKFLNYKTLSPWKDERLWKVKNGSGQNKILRVMNVLPKGIRIPCLGIMHAVLLPKYIKIRAKFK